MKSYIAVVVASVVFGAILIEIGSANPLWKCQHCDDHSKQFLYKAATFIRSFLANILDRLEQGKFPLSDLVFSGYCSGGSISKLKIKSFKFSQSLIR